MDENEIKYLVVRFSSIGDIVLITPVIRCLKEQVEGAVVHCVTKPEYASILEANPYVDKVHVLKTFKETLNKLKDEGFDYLIDLHKSLRSRRLKSRLKVLDFSFPKLNKEKWQIVNLKKNNLPEVHIVERYFEAVNLFDVVNDNKGLDFFILDTDKVEKRNFLTNSESKYIAFAIGGQHQTKQLPVEKIIEICKGINLQIVLLGGKNDNVNGEKIASICENTINLCGKYNLAQSADILRQSDAVITHDTGLMHIAAAFKKEIISIWGNTIPEFGMYPYMAGEKSQIFEIKELKCRPCSKIGFDKCPKKHFDCMNKQDVISICKAVNDIVSL